MPYGMYISAAGAHAQSRRLEILSNNLANVDTPGFKREVAILEARHSEAIAQGQDFPGSRSINDIGGGVLVRESITDFERGIIKQTNIPTDLAIDDNESFFLVQKEDQQLLTRAGNFRFTSDGRLVTQQGHDVLSTGGRPIVIDPALAAQAKITEKGIIELPGEAFPLALVKPQSLGDLVRIGENTFTPLAPTIPVPAQDRRVVSGYLEQSSVSPTLEMMQLIEATRAYETNVKMIQNQDQMLGSLVNRMLRQ